MKYLYSVIRCLAAVSSMEYALEFFQITFRRREKVIILNAYVFIANCYIRAQRSRFLHSICLTVVNATGNYRNVRKVK